jgi:3-oxoadipate enol-lactonase
MSVAEVNGQRISYSDSGGAGPAIVFSHGLLMDGSMFEAQVEALKGDFRCVTWDERGHGDTPATGPFTYWDSTDDVLALLTDLGIEQAVFAGMSQGGFISIRAALRAPDRVRGLILIDTQSGGEDPDVVPLYTALHDEWVANGPEGVQEAVASIILGGGCDPSPWFAKWAELDRASLTLLFRALIDRDEVTDRLGEINQPTLVIHGSDDAAIPMWRAEQLRDGIPGCVDLVVVKGAGHASNVSHPAAVNTAMSEFLAGL